MGIVGKVSPGWKDPDHRPGNALGGEEIFSEVNVRLRVLSFALVALTVSWWSGAAAASPSQTWPEMASSASPANGPDLPGAPSPSSHSSPSSPETQGLYLPTGPDGSSVSSPSKPSQSGQSTCGPYLPGQLGQPTSVNPPTGPDPSCPSEGPDPNAAS